MNHYLDIIMFPIQIIVGIFTIYYTVIALFGMWHRKETNLAAPRAASPSSYRRITKPWSWGICWTTFAS